MQVSWMHSLIMASPSNKVRGSMVKDGNSLGSVTIWMMAPDSFLMENESYREDDSTMYEWLTFSYQELDSMLKLMGLSPDDHHIWRMVQ